ncbi:glutathione S-transferase [Oceaniradius stylonematis]|uniref:glutathione S-transferase n=2 Tax=Alphaproteobacteria TaxID=28211 RepID=UPI00273DB61D|nr:glutathione S-transferase [Oceaniradius stylonematis]
MVVPKLVWLKILDALKDRPAMTALPPVLYSFRRCPYAMRARLAIAASGIAVELREVVLRDKPAAMIQASPKATVPVLVLPDGTVIDESWDVMVWALSQADPECWWPKDRFVRSEVETLVAANDGSFKAALDRYKYPNRYENETISETQQRAIAADHLQPLDARLERHEWLLGDRATLADYAILPFVRQFAHVDRGWFDAQPWPHLRDWLDRFLASERFASIMRKYPQWHPGDVDTVFP